MGYFAELLNKSIPQPIRLQNRTVGRFS